MSTQIIIDALLDERAKVEKALTALGYKEERGLTHSVYERLPSLSTVAAPTPPAAAPFWKSKRSAAARKAQSEKMKAVWAKRRREAKGNYIREYRVSRKGRFVSRTAPIVSALG